MGGFYSHVDEPDISYEARSKAEQLRREQKHNATLKVWIIEQLESMDNDQLELMYNISYDVENYKTFFEVIKRLK